MFVYERHSVAPRKLRVGADVGSAHVSDAVISRRPLINTRGTDDPRLHNIYSILRARSRRSCRECTPVFLIAWWTWDSTVRTFT